MTALQVSPVPRLLLISALLSAQGLVGSASPSLSGERVLRAALLLGWVGCVPSAILSRLWPRTEGDFVRERFATRLRKRWTRADLATIAAVRQQFGLSDADHKQALTQREGARRLRIQPSASTPAEADGPGHGLGPA